MGATNPQDNPQVYFWLLQALLLNRHNAKDSKGKPLARAPMIAEMEKMLLQTVRTFKKLEGTDWYNKLGELLENWADFVNAADRPMSGILVLR